MLKTLHCNPFLSKYASNHVFKLRNFPFRRAHSSFSHTQLTKKKLNYEFYLLVLSACFYSSCAPQHHTWLVFYLNNSFPNSLPLDLKLALINHILSNAFRILSTTSSYQVHTNLWTLQVDLETSLPLL